MVDTLSKKHLLLTTQARIREPGDVTDHEIDVLSEDNVGVYHDHVPFVTRSSRVRRRRPTDFSLVLFRLSIISLGRPLDL